MPTKSTQHGVGRIVAFSSDDDAVPACGSIAEVAGETAFLAEPATQGCPDADDLPQERFRQTV